MISATLKKRLPGRLIDVRFKTSEPGITAIFGRSGAGKTSMINMISGLLRPDEGRIELDGEVLFDSSTSIDLAPEKRQIGYVFQESRLFPHMNVRNNLLYGWRRRAARHRNISLDDVIGVLGLEAMLDRSPPGLSGGEAQRVQFGRAILANPKLLLMDEPLSSLDNPRRLEILPFIERLRDEFQIPILYVTHAMDEIIRLADRLLIIENGLLAADGTVEELTGRLDLRPLTGRYEAGSVIAATIKEHDSQYGLTRLSFPGGVLRVPAIEGLPGASVRLRIRARDVSISTAPPAGASELNIFKGEVVEISSPASSQTAHCDILIDIGVPLWVRITRLSIDQLGLHPGKEIHALIKGTSVDRQSLAARKGEAAL